MSIVTRRGDDGTTGLMFGRRVPKTHPRVRACGALDELTAVLGLARAAAEDKGLIRQLTAIQRDLLKAGVQIATADEDREKFRQAKLKKITLREVRRLERWITKLEENQPSPKGFILPGANSVEAALHLARAVCRRVELEVLAIRGSGGLVDPPLLQYLNRLSDLLWLLALERG